MVDALCAVIRATGISDSRAAARVSVHPSTVSRWKREYPDLAILLRSAREEFRAAQLDLILETANSGRSGGWRAAAWLLERTFPQDYSPRAQERARFQAMEEEALARESEGTLCEEPAAAPVEGKALQNVQNSETRPRPELTSPGAVHEEVTWPVGAASEDDAAAVRLPVRALQNVHNPVLAGRIQPVAAE